MSKIGLENIEIKSQTYLNPDVFTYLINYKGIILEHNIKDKRTRKFVHYAFYNGNVFVTKTEEKFVIYKNARGNKNKENFRSRMGNP